MAAAAWAHQPVPAVPAWFPQQTTAAALAPLLLPAAPAGLPRQTTTTNRWKVRFHPTLVGHIISTTPQSSKATLFYTSANYKRWRTEISTCPDFHAFRQEQHQPRTQAHVIEAQPHVLPPNNVHPRYGRPNQLRPASIIRLPSKCRYHPHQPICSQPAVQQLQHSRRPAIQRQQRKPWPRCVRSPAAARPCPPQNSLQPTSSLERSASQPAATSQPAAPLAVTVQQHQQHPSGHLPTVPAIVQASVSANASANVPANRQTHLPPTYQPTCLPVCPPRCLSPSSPTCLPPSLDAPPQGQRAQNQRRNRQ